MALEIRITKTVKQEMTLTQEQVEEILAEWAAREHGMTGATVEVDAGYEYLRGVTITVEHTEESERTT